MVCLVMLIDISLSLSIVVGMECIVCSSSKVNNLINQVSTCPALKKIITIGPPVSEENRTAAVNAGLEIFTFKEIEVRVL